MQLDPREGQHFSRVTLCVAEAESGPRCPVPRPAVCPRSHAACDLWEQHPPGWDSAPSTLVLHKPAPSPLGGHLLLLSPFPHLLDGRGVPETPGPSQAPSSQGPWTCQSWRLRPKDGSRLPPLCPPSLLVPSWLLGPVYWSYPS